MIERGPSMRELELKYGCNPNQKPARIYMENGELPLEVLCGRPGYINFLDALNSYQLVSEMRAATGVPAAASFKHVSPAGAAIGLVPQMVQDGLAGGNDIAVFTAMCMCWSGYLSTHVAMMDSLGYSNMTGKAIISHTIGGLVAGVAAHWIYILVSML